MTSPPDEYRYSTPRGSVSIRYEQFEMNQRFVVTRGREEFRFSTLEAAVRAFLKAAASQKMSFEGNEDGGK